jgi:MFS family permease
MTAGPEQANPPPRDAPPSYARARARRHRWLPQYPQYPPFRRLLEAQIAHAAGDALVAVALVNTLFFAVPLGQARSKIALYLLLTMTPYSLLSPLVGPLLDRFRGSYRIAIITSAAGRAVLALLLSTRTDRLWLYPLAFGSLVLSRAHGVSRNAMTPDVIPEGTSTVWANSWLAAVSAIAALAFGLPGAAITHFLGPGWTLRFAIGAFAAAAAFGLALHNPAGTGRRETVVADYRAAIHPRVLAAGVATASMRAAVGFLTFMLAFALKARGHSGKGFAAVVVAAAVGGLMAPAITPALRRVLYESALLVAATLGTAAVALVAAGSSGLGTAALVAGVTGVAAGVARLGFDSLLQREAPESVRARTVARYETIFQLFWVGGAGLATAITFGVANGMRALAAICLAGLAASFYRFVRQRPPPRTHAPGSPQTPADQRDPESSI